MRRKIAFIHNSSFPGDQADEQDKAEQHEYLTQVVPDLARMGYLVDIFACQETQGLTEVCEWLENARVIRVPVGRVDYTPGEQVLPFLRDAAGFMIDFFNHQEKRYDLIHANSWLSGLVAVEIKASLGIPYVVTLDTLGRASRPEERYHSLSATKCFEVEERVIREADGIIVETARQRADLLALYHADPTYVVQIPSSLHLDDLLPVAGMQQSIRGAAPASLLREFYENVLAIRRVALIDAAPSAQDVSSPEYYGQLSVVQDAFETVALTFREAREQLSRRIVDVAYLMSTCLEAGGKIMVCGSGAEVRRGTEQLQGHLLASEDGLRIVPVTDDQRVLLNQQDKMTGAIAEEVDALGLPGDVLIGIGSNAGASGLPEIFRRARARSIRCVSIGGYDTADLISCSDVALVLPGDHSGQTDLLQTFLLHLLSELVEKSFHTDRKIPIENLYHATGALQLLEKPVE
jgi:phosphoheptose isomerase